MLLTFFTDKSFLPYVLITTLASLYLTLHTKPECYFKWEGGGGAGLITNHTTPHLISFDSCPGLSELIFAIRNLKDLALSPLAPLTSANLMSSSWFRVFTRSVPSLDLLFHFSPQHYSFFYVGSWLKCHCLREAFLDTSAEVKCSSNEFSLPKILLLSIVIKIIYVSTYLPYYFLNYSSC